MPKKTQAARFQAHAWAHRGVRICHFAKDRSFRRHLAFCSRPI